MPGRPMPAPGFNVAERAVNSWLKHLRAGGHSAGPQTALDFHRSGKTLLRQGGTDRRTGPHPFREGIQIRKRVELAFEDRATRPKDEDEKIGVAQAELVAQHIRPLDRKSPRLNSSH